MKKLTTRIARVVALLLLLFITDGAVAQYLHVDGKKIVNGNNQEVILRGMGLGGWMLQEGYMLETNSFANAQHQIRARIADVIGETNTAEFYNKWLSNHCTKRDIDSLASWGFNSVRLPMHYNLFTLPIEQEPVPGKNTWLEKGFVMTDSLLSWCEANNMYLILDLHAAPGGQGRDAAISDYDASKPSLWESEANRSKTVALWRKLAERYASEPWIGGYDLINEPNWNFSGEHPNGCSETTNGPLRRLYMDITAAIREVDKNHIIFIEGNCWANNYNGIFPVWDNNMVASFHKYWNYNDQGSVQGFINMRDQHNIPIWLGESGENSNVWFRNAIALMESNDIGWAWWPMKKIGSVVNPLTVRKSPGYQDLLNYWKNGGVKPSVETAKAALFGLADNLRIENCIYHRDVTDAMVRQVADDRTIPYASHKIPGTVHATNFDLGRHNQAYADKDTANYHVATGNYTAWNNGWSYRNDGVDIEVTKDTDPGSNGFNVGWTHDGEWLAYTVTVDSTAAYSMTVRYSSSAVTRLKLLVNGVERTRTIDLVSTGSLQAWAGQLVDNIVLYRGSNKLVLFVEKGGMNLGYMKFALSKPVSQTPFEAVAAQTTTDGKRLLIALNKKVAPSTISPAGFSWTANGVTHALQEVSVDAADHTRLILHTDHAVTDKDVVKVRYSGTDVKSVDDTALQHFNELPARNTIPVHLDVPGLVEAERFYINSGFGIESTADAGGGQNLGYTNTNDYAEYLISVDEKADYRLEVRIACMSRAGKLKFEQLSKDGPVLNTVIVDVPVTGGWQTWQTVSEKMALDAGRTLLKVTVVEPEFNLNWFKFTREVTTGAVRDDQGGLYLYPNPVNDFLKLEFPESLYSPQNSVQIRSLCGRVISARARLEEEEFNRLYVGNFPAGHYIVEIELDGKTWTKRFVIQ